MDAAGPSVRFHWGVGADSGCGDGAGTGMGTGMRPGCWQSGARCPAGLAGAVLLWEASRIAAADDQT